MRGFGLVCLFGLFLLHSPSAQDIQISTDSELDWQRGTIRVTITAEAAPGADIRPEFIHRARRRIDAEFPGALFNALLPLNVDSVRIVREVVQAQPELASRITNLAAQAKSGLPHPNPTATALERIFEVPIFPDFVRLFMNHEIPFRMEDVISWVPTTDFTGIVIYAADPLPLRGTDKEVYPAPALLPELYDENLRPVLEQDMVDPESGRRWGVVAYSAHTDEDPWRHRIGPRPLRIMAREVYGIHPTDLIIDEDDADLILASDHNRELLRTGRILVVLHPSQIRVID
jgi:hypothetical protein